MAMSCVVFSRPLPAGEDRENWRRRADSNRRIEVLQTSALTTWLRRRCLPNLQSVPGAEEEIRTPTGLLPLPPQDSVSTYSTTSARPRTLQRPFV